MDVATIFAAAFLLIGAPTLLFGIRLMVRRVRLLKRGRPAAATVAKLEHVKGSPGRRGGYLLHYAYTDESGQMHIGTHDRFYYGKRHRVGEALAVRYDPADPARSFLDSRIEALPMPIAMIAGGGLVTLLALAMFAGR